MVQSTCPLPPPPHSGDEDAILESLITIGRATRKRLDAGADQGSHWLLFMLSRSDPIRARDLAHLCGLDTSTVSRHLRQLEDDGLIERRPDPEDGRAHLISPSPEGMNVANARREARRRVILDRLADWPAADVTALATLLSRLADEVGGGVDPCVLPLPHPFAPKDTTR